MRGPWTFEFLWPLEMWNRPLGGSDLAPHTAVLRPWRESLQRRPCVSMVRTYYLYPRFTHETGPRSIRCHHGVSVFHLKRRVHDQERTTLVRRLVHPARPAKTSRLQNQPRRAPFSEQDAR